MATSDEIKFTPKAPRENVPGRFTNDSYKKMSKGGKKGGAKSTHDASGVRSGLLKRFLKNNPLNDKSVYARLVHFTEPNAHIRHYVVEEIHVSLNGVDWYEVKDIIEMINMKHWELNRDVQGGKRR